MMLTGDSRTTGEAVARRLGLDAVQAEVLPERRVEVVKRHQAEGHIVAIARDGINDAPVLVQSHVGIAMGAGTDVAVESAGMTFVKGDLHRVVRARKLSRATMRNIRQYLFFAFSYNALGVPVARCPLHGVRAALKPDDGKRRDDLQLGLRHWQCAPAAEAGAIIERREAIWQKQKHQMLTRGQRRWPSC